MLELVFVRHGQTHANAVGRWEGWTDPPLTAAGQAQARSLGRRLVRETAALEAVYTSPLRRAHRTAQIIGEAFALKPIVVEGLKEIHFGNLEGISLDEMEKAYPELHARWQDRSDMQFRWPGGEQRAEFFRRAANACERICGSHEEGTIAAVAHGGTIRACLAHLLPEVLGKWWGYELDNAGVTRVRITGGGASLVVLNDTDHLVGEDTGAGVD